MFKKYIFSMIVSLGFILPLKGLLWEEMSEGCPSECINHIELEAQKDQKVPSELSFEEVMNYYFNYLEKVERANIDKVDNFFSITPRIKVPQKKLSPYAPELTKKQANDPDFVIPEKYWINLGDKVESLDMSLKGPSIKDYIQELARYNQEKNTRHEEVYKNFLDEKGKEVVKTYHIYLMPQPADSIHVIDMIIELLRTMPELSEYLTNFKVALEHFLSISNKPRVVLSLFGNKVDIEYILDRLCSMFKNTEGINQVPPFSRKISSLIYYTQGDEGDKEELTRNQLLDNYFESDGVHYRKDFAGLNQDYHLNVDSCGRIKSPRNIESIKRDLTWLHDLIVSLEEKYLK